MRSPTRSPATATPRGTPPWPAARRRFARSGRVRIKRGEAARLSSLVCGTARRAEAADLDDLPFDDIAAAFADPPHGLDDLVVSDLFGRPAIFANHELALMGMLDIDAGDKRARGLDLVDQLVGEQEFERPVNRWRPEPLPPRLQLRQESVGADRLARLQDQLEHAPPQR